MWPFGGEKTKRRSARPSPARVPTGRVITLSSQGMSEPEIIQSLKGEGYTPMQVDQAMKEALKTSVGSTGPAGPPGPPVPPAPAQSVPEGRPPEPPMNDFTPSSRDMLREEIPTLPPLPGEEQLPPAPSRSMESALPERNPLSIDMPLRERPTEPPLPGEDMIPRLREPMDKREAKEEKRRALEELAEAIIEEKWAGLREEIMNIKAQIQDVGFKTGSLEQSIKKLEGDKKTDMEHIEDKIDTYKQAIGEVSARMESIEKAMKDSLSPMMQSLRSLTETIRTMKTSPSKQ